jgi:N-methylhydantoinase A
LLEEGLGEGVSAKAIEVKESVDCRYRGQSFTINLPWRGIGETVAMFHARHAKLYGHQLQHPVELVTLRTKVQSAPAMVELPSMQHEQKKSDDQRSPLPPRSDMGLPVYAREELMGMVTGPALITERVSTTYLAPGWECRPDEHGSLLLLKINRAK